MARVTKKSVDSIKRAPKRTRSYEAPVVSRSKKRTKGGVPKEYRTFKRAPKRRGGLIFFLFIIFIAAMIGFIYWSNQNMEQTDASLKLTVVGPEKIISGDEVNYVIEYTNLDKVPLSKMKLSVYWPTGFYFDKASLDPADANAKTWELDDLAPGQKATIKIDGQLVGKKDEVLRASFNLDYQPVNFHSDFREQKKVETKITDNKIEVAIETIDKTLVETEQEIKVIYRNLTKDVLENLHLDILYPDDWIIESVEPTKEGDYWVTNLEAEEEKAVLIKGNFGVDSRPDQVVVAEIGNMVDENFRRLARAEHEIIVVNPKFDIGLEVNGKTGDQQVDWGDILRYQLEITNQSDGDIADVQISTLLAGDLLDWDSLDTIGEYLEERIIWTAEEDEELSLWPKGATKTFTWQVNVVEEPQPERAIENIIQINIANLVDWQQLDTPSELTVGESLSFNNGVYWHLGGRRVGSGLLPPQVDAETEYLVVWSLPQSTGSFDSVTVSTILPPSVDYNGNAEVGEGNFDFDNDDRSLTWQLDDFQDLLLPVTASFMISIVPTEDDRGQAMTLMNPVTASASGQEEVVVRSKVIKTTDVVAESSEPIGIVQ